MLRRAIKRGQNLPDKGSKSSKRKIEKDVFHKTALADPTTKEDAEKILEDVVLGAEEELVDNLTKPKVLKSSNKRKSKNVNKAAWQDDEDDTKHTIVDKLSANPQWAKLKWEKSESEGEESDAEADVLLQSTGDYLRSTESLPKNVIQMKKCTDANKEKPSNGKVKSVEFHPSAQVLLTAGMDHALNLFQIDGKNNPKIQSVFLEKFPIYCAHFAQDGTQVVLSSRHRGFIYYDMMAGKVVKVPKIKGMEEKNMKRFIMSPDGRFIVFLGDYGYMHFISASSKEWIDTIKMNGSVESAAFSSDGQKLFSIGDDGEAYVWDVNSRTALHRFRDEGCIQGTAIAVSKNNRYIATGSYSGVVNLYDESCLTSANPVPLRAVMNLVTPCTDLKFNASTEILAMGSNYSEQALKLLHVPSQSVFNNFPDRTESLRIPFSMDFSANSGYYCVGNQCGQAILYRVKHYGSY